MLLVALYTPGIGALRISIINTIFNWTGIMIWYPIPHMRNSLLYAAQNVGYCARVFRLFPIFYVALLYFGAPILLLTLSNLYSKGNSSTVKDINNTFAEFNNVDGTTSSDSISKNNAWFLVLAISITIIISIFVIGMTYFCKWKDGGNKMRKFFELYLSSLSSTKVTVNNSSYDNENFNDDEILGKNQYLGDHRYNNDDEMNTNGRYTNRRTSNEYNYGLIPPPYSYADDDDDEDV